MFSRVICFHVSSVFTCHLFHVSSVPRTIFYLGCATDCTRCETEPTNCKACSDSTFLSGSSCICKCPPYSPPPPLHLICPPSAPRPPPPPRTQHTHLRHLDRTPNDVNTYAPTPCLMPLASQYLLLVLYINNASFIIGGGWADYRPIHPQS